MVRRIVGTMLNLAAKDLPIQELKKIIDMQDPRQTLVETAPANGLYLTQVKYPEEKLSFEDLK
jgi:tRNA U38,U39,U40 pseudouridine synthase TruA